MNEELTLRSGMSEDTLHLLEVGKNTIFTTLSQGNTVEQMISGILFLYYAPIIKPSLILGGRDIDF